MEHLQNPIIRWIFMLFWENDTTFSSLYNLASRFSVTRFPCPNVAMNYCRDLSAFTACFIFHLSLWIQWGLFSSCLFICFTVRCVCSWREEHHRLRWTSRVTTPWVLLCKLPTPISSPCELSLTGDRSIIAVLTFKFREVEKGKLSCWDQTHTLLLLKTERLPDFNFPREAAEPMYASKTSQCFVDAL